MDSQNRRVMTLERQIQEPKTRWPVHSVPTGMLQWLDDMDDQLETVLEKANRVQSEAKAHGHRESQGMITRRRPKHD